MESKDIKHTIIHFPVLDSTNNKAKEMAENGCDDGLIVVADEQTSGRGRLGRSWISPKDSGIYMSIILRPCLTPSDAQKLTLIAALAVCSAIDNYVTLDAAIKWPNDILLANKKVCGILTEVKTANDAIKYAIIGIGVNVNLPSSYVPLELKDKITSLQIELGRAIDKKGLFESIVKEFDKKYYDFVYYNKLQELLKEYRKKCISIGKKAIAFKGEDSREVMVRDIDSDGALLVIDKNGHIERIISGEVSIRGVEGYV